MEHEHELEEKYISLIEKELSQGIPFKEVAEHLAKIVHEDVEAENN